MHYTTSIPAVKIYTCMSVCLHTHHKTKASPLNPKELCFLILLFAVSLECEPTSVDEMRWIVWSLACLRASVSVERVGFRRSGYSYLVFGGSGLGLGFLDLGG